MPHAPPLAVLTWNIGRFHLGMRINRMLRHDSRAHDKALRHVARIVVGTEAEVVVLQELRSRAQLERLLELLGDAWSGAMGPAAGSDRAVALLLRERGRAALHHTVALPGGRNAEVVEGRGWIAIGVHFDAFRPIVRRRQAEGLVEFVDSRREDIVIVAGDLNIDLRYPLHAAASDRIFMAAITRSFRDLGHGRGPTVLGRRRLDYVLVRGAAEAEARVLRRKRVPLGDHDPLLAHIVLPPTSSTAPDASQVAAPRVRHAR